MRASRYCLLALFTVAPWASAREPAFANRPLAAWVADLDHADPLIRDEAIEVLARMGSSARSATARLEALAKGASPVARRRISLAIWKIDGRAELALAEHRTWIAAARGADKVTAFEILQQLGESPDRLAPHLVDIVLLSDPARFPALSEFAHQLGEVGARALAAALPRARSELQASILNSISGMGDTALPVIPQLQELLKHPDARTRIAVVRVLWNLDADRPALLKLILAAAADTNASVRVAVTQFAVAVRPRPRELAPIFEMILKETGKPGPAKCQAVQALWEIDPKSLDANLSVLLDALKSSNSTGESVAALSALAAIGPPARKALPALLELAAQPPGRTQLYLVSRAIARMGPEAVEPVLKLLENSTTPAQAIALRALSEFGADQIPKLGPALRLTNPNLVRQVLVVLMRNASACAPLVKDLATIVESKDPIASRTAAMVLAEVGPAAVEAVPSLVKALGRANMSTELSAVLRALGKLGAPAKEAVPRVVELMEHGPGSVRWAAVEALLQIDPTRRDAAMKALMEPADRREGIANLSTLISALRAAGVTSGEMATFLRAEGGVDANRRIAVLNALQTIQPIPPEFLPTLRQWAGEGEPRARAEAAALLARQGDAAAGTLAVLRDAVHQPDLRDRAANALATLGSKAGAAVPDLLAEWRTATAPELRMRLAEALFAIDPKAAAATTLDWLRQESTTAFAVRRVAATRMLARFDAPNPALVKAVRRLLRDPNPFVAGQATECVVAMGAGGRELLPDLRAMLSHATLHNRTLAANALWRLGVKPEEIVPVLSAALTLSDTGEDGIPNPSRASATMAAMILGEIGPPAAAAVPSLQQAMTLGDANLRQAAANALVKIEGKK